MSAKEEGVKLANTGKLRPSAGSDTHSQQRQKAFDDQQTKINSEKNGKS